MGSLPNLNELCQENSQRRSTAEKERDAVRERAQQLEFISRDYKNNRSKDQPPTLFQVKANVATAFFVVSFFHDIFFLFKC